MTTFLYITQMKDELNKAEIIVIVSNKVKRIGIRIKIERCNKKMSQQDLAFYCRSDKCLISEIERGACSNITLLTLMKIAKALDINEDDLFCG